MSGFKKVKSVSGEIEKKGFLKRMKAKIEALLEIKRQVTSILTKEQKRQSVGAFAAMLVAAVFELLGVTMVVPFIAAIMNADSLMQNLYVSNLMKFLNISSARSLLFTFGILLFVVYVVKNILLLYSRYIQNRYVRNLEKNMSMTMLKSYMERPYEFFVNTNTAELMRGMDSDVFSFVTIITTLFSIIAETITMAFIIVFVFVTDWFTAITLSLFAGICVVAITFGCKNLMRKAGEKYQKAVTWKSKSSLQIFGGIKDIYVTKRKEKFVNEYDKASDMYKGTLLLYDLVRQIPERIIEVVLVCGVIFIVCIRIFQGMDPYSYVPKLSALAVACFRLLPSMNKLTSGITQIIFYQPGLSNIYRNITDVRKDGQSCEQIEVCNDLKYDKKIEVSNINWKYLNGKNNVLSNLSLEIKKGESIAIIGKSGEGKTTFADVILGLLQPQEGKILVDGQDIYNNLDEWAKHIGYVPQSVFLMDDTIRANILFGEDPADDEKVWYALKQAQLDEYVRNLPEGLDTMVGERGIKFSGGQRQRIAIARALYYNPEILVFDEATSALDDGTEKAVMEAINSLQGTKTLIIIAHRLSTIENCDKIYEIKNGQAILRKKEEIYA